MKENLKKLREPFPENQISKLPKPTCELEKWKALPKARCGECGGYHATSNTIHLSYVGHAALTDRLLDVDPDWNWMPLAVDTNGLPLLDKDGGMWIKLTICGITRLGYGDSQGKTGCNATKERIGDALRNAAMRFGAALELWHKGDLHGDSEDDAEGTKKPPVKYEAKKPANTDFLKVMKNQYERVGNEAYNKVMGAAGYIHAEDITDRKAQTEIYNELVALPSKKEEVKS